MSWPWIARRRNSRRNSIDREAVLRRILEEDPCNDLTDTGSVMGTPHYISPEALTAAGWTPETLKVMSIAADQAGWHWTSSEGDTRPMPLRLVKRRRRPDV